MTMDLRKSLAQKMNLTDVETEFSFGNEQSETVIETSINQAVYRATQLRTQLRMRTILSYVYRIKSAESYLATQGHFSVLDLLGPSY